MSKMYRRWKMHKKGKMKVSFREYRRSRHSIQKICKKHDKYNSIIKSLPLHKNDFSNIAKYLYMLFPEEKIYTGNLRNFQNKEEQP